MDNKIGDFTVEQSHDLLSKTDTSVFNMIAVTPKKKLIKNLNQSNISNMSF